MSNAATELLGAAEVKAQHWAECPVLLSKHDREILKFYERAQIRARKARRRICQNCGKHRSEHANRKCLFDSGTFVPAFDMAKHISAIYGALRTFEAYLSTPLPPSP